MKKLLTLLIPLFAITITTAQDEVVNGKLTVKGHTYGQYFHTTDNNATGALFTYPGNHNLYLGAGKDLEGNKNKIILYNLSCDGGCNVPQIQLLTDNLYTPGRVGIGTTSPKEKLSLSGPGVSLGIYDTNPLSKANNRIARYGNSLVIQNDLSGSWTDNINFADNGNVGIGARNPNFALTISSKEDPTQLGGNKKSAIRIANSYSTAFGGKSEIQFGLGQSSNQLLGVIAAEYTSWGNNIGGDLVFGTTPTSSTEVIERLRINKDGNVGLGTKNPAAKLDVNGRTIMRDGLDFGTNLNNHGSEGMISWGSEGFVVKAMQNKKLFLGANNDSNQMVINTNGNVGIGTTNPSSNLHIKDLDNAPILNITGQTSNTGNDELISEIRLSNLYDNLAGHRASIKAVSDKSGSHGNVAFQFNTSIFNGQQTEVQAMRISSNGNVGIGTTDTKGYKLGVNGKIAATEVKVALYNTWPDYVFEEAYKLPTLQEVENHIQTKGHLINIPSAIEVAEDGIMLGEMDSKLLQKIEELTLYTIAQEKKIKELELLNAKFSELQSRLEKLESGN